MNIHEYCLTRCVNKITEVELDNIPNASSY